MTTQPPSRFQIMMDIEKLETMSIRDRTEVDKMNIDIRFYDKKGEVIDGVVLQDIIVEKAPRMFQGIKHAIHMIALNSREIMKEE
jgi:hypothetical protein